MAHEAQPIAANLLGYEDSATGALQGGPGGRMHQRLGREQAARKVCRDARWKQARLIAAVGACEQVSPVLWTTCMPQTGAPELEHHFATAMEEDTAQRSSAAEDAQLSSPVATGVACGPSHAPAGPHAPSAAPALLPRTIQFVHPADTVGRWVNVAHC